MCAKLQWQAVLINAHGVVNNLNLTYINCLKIYYSVILLNDIHLIRFVRKFWIRQSDYYYQLTGPICSCQIISMCLCLRYHTCDLLLIKHPLKRGLICFHVVFPHHCHCIIVSLNISLISGWILTILAVIYLRRGKIFPHAYFWPLIFIKTMWSKISFFRVHPLVINGHLKLLTITACY